MYGASRRCNKAVDAAARIIAKLKQTTASVAWLLRRVNCPNESHAKLAWLLRRVYCPNESHAKLAWLLLLIPSSLAADAFMLAHL